VVPLCTTVVEIHAPATATAALELRVAVAMEVAAWVPPLPRVGIQLALPASLRQVYPLLRTILLLSPLHTSSLSDFPEPPRCDPSRPLRQVDWLGLGPHESYVDRQRAARLGAWRLDARRHNARVPYPRPQVATTPLFVEARLALALCFLLVAPR
jgi:hypothetical protein